MLRSGRTAGVDHAERADRNRSNICSASPVGLVMGRREHFVGDVKAEGAVGFELRFVEKLVGGRFMGEFFVTVGILGHVSRLISGQGRFQVDQQPWRRTVIDTVVADQP